MSDMTPEQARAELSIIAHPDDPGRFAEVGIRALETLAADTIEYGVEYTGRNTGHRFTGSDAAWSPEQGLAAMEYRRMKKSGMNPRLVARRVSAPWEVTDE